jgi:hypothetical protein
MPPHHESASQSVGIVRTVEHEAPASAAASAPASDSPPVEDVDEELDPDPEELDPDPEELDPEELDADVEDEELDAPEDEAPSVEVDAAPLPPMPEGAPHAVTDATTSPTAIPFFTPEMVATTCVGGLVVEK